MSDKKISRQRRARKTRERIRRQGAVRLTIHRTPRHFYAQVIDPAGGRVLASASTLQADVRKELKGSGNVEAAGVVGRIIAERARAAGLEKVAFDRSGFMYHGRVKAFADAARESGLKF